MAASVDATVAVLTHNRAEEVVRTLSNLRALPEAPPLLVVDNASSDDTRARLQACHPQVPEVVLPANLGAAARNIGVRLAHTPFVALCDDDTWWEAGSLARACRHERRPLRDGAPDALADTP